MSQRGAPPISFQLRRQAPTRIRPIPIDADSAPTASRMLPRRGHVPALVDGHLWRVGSANGVTTIRTHRIAPTGGSFKPASPDRARTGRTVRLNPHGHRTAVTVQCQLRVVGVSRLIRFQQGGAPPLLACQAAVAPDLIKLPVKLFPDRNRITTHVRCDLWVKLHLIDFVAQPERRFEGAGCGRF